jgi:hypothetical protein
MLACGEGEKRMMRFDSQRWATLSPLLDRLLDEHEQQRLQSLAEIRSWDAALADELSSLLLQQDAIERRGFLEGQVLQSQEMLAFVVSVARLVGTPPTARPAAEDEAAAQDCTR